MNTRGDSSLERLCGQLILGGFASHELPVEYAAALRSGRRAGAILFKRNLPDCKAAFALTQQLSQSAGTLPPLIAIDQEGGRVARLGAPLLQPPSMRTLARSGDVELIEAVAAALGQQLAALGFNLNFAPVLDVDSNPENPVIGDRAFGSVPDQVVRGARAVCSGLLKARIIPCGKHFPGHGDTWIDSHIALPTVAHDLERLERIEFAPFRAMLGELPSIMSAHVVYTALDPTLPATLSYRALAGLARDQMGFAGAIFSDDMEMGAIAARFAIEDSAVGAVRAGCDMLLICHSWDTQERALAALIREAQRDRSFLDRCREASNRTAKLRQKYAPAPAQNYSEAARSFETPEALRLHAKLLAMQSPHS